MIGRALSCNPEGSRKPGRQRNTRRRSGGGWIQRIENIWKEIKMIQLENVLNAQYSPRSFNLCLQLQSAVQLLPSVIFRAAWGARTGAEALRPVVKSFSHLMLQRWRDRLCLRVEMWVIPLLCNVAHIVLWFERITTGTKSAACGGSPRPNNSRSCSDTGSSSWWLRKRQALPQSRVREDIGGKIRTGGAGSSASLTQSAVNILWEELESCSTTALISWTKVLKKLFPQRGAVLQWSTSCHFLLLQVSHAHKRPTAVFSNTVLILRVPPPPPNLPHPNSFSSLYPRSYAVVFPLIMILTVFSNIL